ncbi:MAG TPA: tetratricopeptide repeat protein [Actinomycetes bacterium]|nr:tetratricopeptide repeat protein [Actinomycetes bacterium]
MSGKPTPEGAGSDAIDVPGGDVYDWYRRGCRLLDEGNAAAAVQLLVRVTASEPDARSARETLGRARLAAGHYSDAERDFAHLVASAPDDDYAHLGLGMAMARQGRFAEAVEHLALAVAMRPDRPEYASQLDHARATLAARQGQR